MTLKRNLLVLSLLLIWVAKGQLNFNSHFTEPAQFNKQLLQNTVAGIAKDDLGMLWTITQYGCYRFDGFNTSIFLNSNTPFLRSDRYRALFSDKTNNRLILVGENDYYHIKNGRLLKKQNDDSTLIQNPYNYLIAPKNRLNNFTPNHTPLIGSGVLFFKKDTILLQKGNYFNYTDNKWFDDQQLKELDFNTVLYRKGKNYCIKKNGLHEIKYEGGLTTISFVASLNGFTRFIPNNDDQAIWVENDDEVRKINPANGKFLMGFRKPNSTNLSLSILEDTINNRIFLGTVKKGVLEIRNKQITNLAAENYTSSYAFNSYLNSYCIATKEGITYFKKNKLKALLPQKDILNLYIYSDEQNRIWYQTNQGKINITNPINNKILFSLPFVDFMVNIIQLDSARFLISNHHSIYSLNLKDQKLISIFTPKDQSYIYDFCYFNKSLVVSTNNGIYISNGHGNAVKHFLAGTTIRKSIQIDKNTLAIGSYGKGVLLLKNNTLFTSDINKNPQLSAVVSLSLDADSALWVLCNKGAFIWNKPQVKGNSMIAPDHILAVESDLPCSELNGGLNPSVFPMGEIALPSSDGLLVFNKKDLIYENKDIKINLRGISLNDSMLSSVTDFTVPSGNRNLKFFIDAADLTGKESAIAEYRIQKLDTNWTVIPQNRILEFSRLSKGIYELEIRQHATLRPQILSRFNVLPYWYETIWARVLFLLTLLLSMYGIFKIRIKRQERYQKKLELTIQEKTKSLQETITKLNASEKELKKQHRQRNKLYSILMHDIKSPINFLSTYSLQQISKNILEEKEAMKVIAKSSSELSSFINEFLFWLGNQSKHESIHLKEVNISNLLGELASFYQNIASLNENRIFYFDNNKNMLFSTDPDRLKIIIRNLLDNANKYTKNGIIKISSILDNKGSLIITIEDSGKGVPEHIENLINNSGTTEEISPSINANHKMGLMISKELTGQLKGTISVISNEITGTVFTLCFNS
jgi:signal transduction histidine kinase